MHNPPPGATGAGMKFALAIFLLVAAGAAVFVLATAVFARRYAPEAPSRGLDTLAWFIREWAASVAVVPWLGLGMLPAGRPKPGRSPAGRVPVLLVHGYDMNRTTMWPLTWYLRSRGWRWAHAVNHGPWGNPIAGHARHLADHIAELKRVSGAPQIDIVAHSMGGLIAGWYIARMNGAGDVRRLVTIGTPWQGTHTAYLGRKAEARDLEPESAVIADVAHLPVPVTSIWTPTDQIVVPAASSAIASAQSVELPLAGHLDMLVDGRVFAAVRDALSQPDAPSGASA